jgi:long-chain acyl-CoA synthetase
VPSDFDFPAVPLTRLLDDAANAFPSAPAVSSGEIRRSYRQLRDDVDRVAGGLRDLGVQPQDRVALVLANSLAHVVTFFAVQRLGATVVACNPLGTEPELAEQLALVRPRVVVAVDRAVPRIVAAVPPDVPIVVATGTDFLPRARRAALRLPLPAARRLRAELVADVHAGRPTTPLRALLRAAPAPQADVDARRDVAVLQFTGGTTGAPKAARLTAANLVANAYQMRLWLPDAASGTEATLGVLPLFHVYGLTDGLLLTVLLAGRLVLLPRFDVDRLLTAVETERVTLLPAVPPIFAALADAVPVRHPDLSSLRFAISGAMRLDPEVQERFERVTGVPLLQGYGTTECSPATHCNPVEGVRKRGTVGVPLPGTCARIADPGDPNRVLGAGEPGELQVAGPQVSAGYEGPGGEPELVDGRWLRTGDVAVMDADGYFRIVDRLKDVIVVGGFNVYPGEVETVLASLPGVADAVVAGVPDRHRGEVVKAFVVPAPGAQLTVEQVRAHCAERLSAYKVPRVVEFREALPRSAVGKALRRLLVDGEASA